MFLTFFITMSLVPSKCLLYKVFMLKNHYLVFMSLPWNINLIISTSLPIQLSEEKRQSATLSDQLEKVRSELQTTAQNLQVAICSSDLRQHNTVDCLWVEEFLYNQFICKIRFFYYAFICAQTLLVFFIWICF